MCVVYRNDPFSQTKLHRIFLNKLFRITKDTYSKDVGVFNYSYNLLLVISRLPLLEVH